MNIFALSDDPVNAAVWQADAHVCKMTLETAQLVSQAVRLRPDWLAPFERGQAERPIYHQPVVLYGVTHQHHPCARWARYCKANLTWLCNHGLALADEYTERYGRVHKSRRVIQAVADTPFPEDGLEQTPFAQAMPDAYAERDSVLAYRRYYLGEKVSGNAWRRRSHLPDWLLTPVVTQTKRPR